MIAPDSRRLQFGVFEVDRPRGDLRKGGIKIKLQEQPFQVLGALLERPGEIVTRDELRQKIWAADTFVDFDQSLNKAINKIREALCDSAENPRFLETVPRRGYRFIAPVNSLVHPQQPSAQDSSRVRPSPRYVLVVVLAVGILAVVLFTWEHRPSTHVRQAPVADSHANVAPSTAGPASPLEQAILPPRGKSGPGVRIMCGQRKPHNDHAGRSWGEDQYFDGGDYWERPPAPLGRTFDPSLFQNARKGDFSYHIPLESGVYELHLYFAETLLGSGSTENSRTFHVVLGDGRILSNFDIVSDAGGAGVADERVFRDISPGHDGLLHLRFVSLRSQAMVSAIEVEPSRLHRLNPIRIVAQESSYKDSNLRAWMPDNFWMGGTMGIHLGVIKGTEDPLLYSKERYGNFSYAIPVDESKYAVTLHLTENYWGRENPGGGGVGSRVFDVFCNGVALARGIDVYKEAGANRALLKTFHHLKPNSQGKLLLSFVPVENYALLNALEVEDEAGK